MRNLKFKYAKAINFLCFGEEGIEINFEQYGNIVCIKGKNLDVNNEDGSIASNGSGKCFGLNTPILMYNGTIKKVQDIMIGDLVMGHDGTPRTVTSLGRGTEMLYKVIPTKGESYVINESHVLSLKSSDKKNNRYENHWSKRDGVYNISVKDYLEESKSFRHIMHGYRSAVDFKEKKLIIDPYFLGLWLGDGTSTEASITNLDLVVVKEIKREAAKRSLKIGINQNKYKSCPTYRINSFIQQKKTLGNEAIIAYNLKTKKGLTCNEIVVELKKILPYYKNKILRSSTVWRWIKYARDWIASGNELPKVKFEEIPLHKMTNPNTRNSLFNDLKYLDLFNNKHVPLCYKTSSRRDRLELLAGYLDTDGYYTNGGYEFSSKFKTLAEDVAFVARSLGLACYLKETIKASQNGTKGLYYRGYISGDCSVIPVKINYKKSKKRRINKDPLVVGIKIEPIGVGDYYGFVLKENPLFLLGDFTVVHNSSVPEIIVYALYGKTIKKPKKLSHPDIINNKSGDGLMVELIWDDYRLVRTRSAENKGTLRLWRSDKGEWNKDTEISGSGIPATQKEIEKIVGLTYESFINIFIFSDDNTLPFLECDGPTKREIVENLLSLEKYRNYFQCAKDLLKDLKDEIKILTKEYESKCEQKSSITLRISQVEAQEQDWYTTRKKELDNLLLEVKIQQDKLEKSKTGEALAAYQKAQERIVVLKELLVPLEEEKVRLTELISATSAKSVVIDEKIKKSEEDVKVATKGYKDFEKIVNENKKIIEDVRNKTGKACPYCLSVVEESKFADIIEKAEQALLGAEPVFEQEKVIYNNARSNYDSCVLIKQKIDKGLVEFRNKFTKTNSEISNLHCEISEKSKVEKPNADVSELLIYNHIESLKKQVDDKQKEIDGLTPFENIKQTAYLDLLQKIKECDDKKEEVKKSEFKVPYYDFWVKAFSDDGIRKYVIDGIIPTLNDRIEYWLQFLIDNKIKLTFDDRLDETIDRYPFNGRPYIYHGMSGGQRRRLNLTVAAAWAFISSLNSGADPSIIFLDEVTMNMDIVGVQGIFRMICELAKEKQVFVIDHNETLLQMLDGCDTIYLEMQDEISKKVSCQIINEKISS